jgi:hypothetical protein
MPLTTLIDLTGPVGWMAMLMPFAALAVAMMMALFDRTGRSRPPADRAMPTAAVERAAPAPAPAPVEAAPAPASPAPTPLAQPTPAPTPSAPRRETAAPPGPAAPASQRATPVAPEPRPLPQAVATPPAAARSAAPPPAVSPPPEPAAAPPSPPPAPAAPVVSPAEIADIERKIRAAVAQSDEASVARLSLTLAKKLTRGNDDDHDVEAYLRRSIMIAMRLGDTETHAQARLELGDRVGARGDMITACEHWQIARQIYWDGNRAEGIAEADRRMIANGCPTDWVLNDF